MATAYDDPAQTKTDLPNTDVVKKAPLPLGGLGGGVASLATPTPSSPATLGGVVGSTASTLQAPTAPPVTPDPMAFQPPPGQPPVTPNPAFAPPGGYGTNTAQPQANGDPAAPAGFFDAFHNMEAASKAALANGPQPNANQGFRDFTTGQDVSNAAGQASLHAQQVADATAQLPGKETGARFTDTLEPGTDLGAANPTTSTQDWINNRVATAESPNGGANTAALIPESQKIQAHAGPANTSGGSGYLGADGQLVIPGGANTPWDATQNPNQTSSGIGLPIGPALDTGNPAGGGLSLATLGQAGTNSGTGNTGPNAGVGLSETDPLNSLISKTITPNNQVDRVKNFQDSLQSTIKNVIDPAYDASSRNLNRYNFGAGRGISGGARTSQGDLANQREQRIADLSAQGLNQANTGSIDDLYRNIGIAQQQQGFQQGQSNTAFNQNLQATQLEDQLTNSAAGRALQQTLQGFGMSPEQTSLILSSIFGNQASSAGQAAAGLFGQAGQKAGTSNANNLTPDIIAQIIKQLGGGGGQTTNDGGYEVGPQ